MIGQKLGKYTVLEVVGSGSMGTVYRAEDPNGMPVALKLVRSKILTTMELRERFLRDALIASEIRHENICPTLEIGDENDDFFVVMPLVDGITLERFLNGKSISYGRAVDIAMSVGSALEVIHKAGSAHRNLKPANIWILNREDLCIQLSDCCIGRCTEIVGRSRIACFGLGRGFADIAIPPEALAYMSPEQIRGEPLDCRTDIFSLGVVLYEMLTGRHPFEARNSLSRIGAIFEGEPEPFISKQTGIPERLDAILLRSLAKNRDDRYPTVSEMLAALTRTRESEPSPQPIQKDAIAGIRRWFISRLRRHTRK
jgi:serine/threonine protein kinase